MGIVRDGDVHKNLDGGGGGSVMFTYFLVVPFIIKGVSQPKMNNK